MTPMGLRVGCLLFCIWFAGVTTVRAQSQTSSATLPAFEVATIKPSGDMNAAVRAGKMPHIGINVDDERVDIGYLTLERIIAYAYKVKPYQVRGPDWMKSAHWDIAATLPEGATRGQVPEMMQALLADRFKLVIRHDTKEMAALALEVGKNGVKMATSPPDPLEKEASSKKDTSAYDSENGQARVRPLGQPAGNMRVVSVENGVMRIESSKMTMDILSQQLTDFLGQPVLDQTNLTGDYVVAVDISMMDLQAIARSQGMVFAGADSAAGPSNSSGIPSLSDPSGGLVYASIEKLGLKLNKRKLLVDIIVVDRLEKTPTEN